MVWQQHNHKETLVGQQKQVLFSHTLVGEVSAFADVLVLFVVRSTSFVVDLTVTAEAMCVDFLAVAFVVVIVFAFVVVVTVVPAAVVVTAVVVTAVVVAAVVVAAVVVAAVVVAAVVVVVVVVVVAAFLVIILVGCFTVVDCPLVTGGF